MQEVITEAALEIAAAILSIVVAVAAAYLARAKKAVYESEQVRRYVEAVNTFDQDIFAMINVTARAAAVKASDLSDELASGEEFAWAYDKVADYVNKTAAATGVRIRFTDEHLQSLVRGALEDARKHFWSCAAISKERTCRKR